jgi:5-methylcytosine-specific restriction endonuclease McrA
METDRTILRLVETEAAALAVPRLHSVRLLSLDAHGRVLDWMSWQDAACLYARGAVAWTLGDPCLTVHGGQCRATGIQSIIDLHPIVAAKGHARPHALDPTPALTNAALFARDQHLCLYCGHEFPRPHLTRDHVVPLSKGGRDAWENVVSACFHCNSRKGGRTPQQASMPLLAVPYRPSWIEHLILSNRHILADQMAFLRSHLPKRTRAIA